MSLFLNHKLNHTCIKQFITSFILLFFCLFVYGQDYETNSSASINFPPKSYDIKNYSKIPVIKKLGDCFDKSFIYKFKVGTNSFRAVHIRADTFPEAVTVQKLQGNKWCNRLEFYHEDKMEDIRLKDVNNDGYRDILRKGFFDSEIYLFNPKINNFIDSVCGEYNDENYLIDTLKNIYCDFQEYRQGCSSIFSTLYTYKNYSKYYLYKLDLNNCEDEEHSIITKLILSKCINGDLEKLKKIKTYKLKKGIKLPDNDDKYFDNKKFWIKEYKLLSHN